MLQFTMTQSVKILAGDGFIQKIGELVAEAGYKKAFIVCGGSAVRNGTLNIVTEKLKEHQIDSVVFDKVVPDPPATIVNEGGAYCKKENCDCVIALGGGSAIDMAKGINVLRFNDGDILQYATNPMNKCTGLIAIPTTAGTGSELSNGAIISDLDNNTKVPILMFDNMCEYALLDPELTIDVPVSVTKATGFDVFSHAAEAYTSVLANPVTDILCEKIMQIVVEYLPRVVKDGHDMEAREQMLYAASLAGNMLYHGCAHVGHSIAHVIGAKYHLVHGECCAYDMPPVLEWMSEMIPDKVSKIGKILGAEFDGSETARVIGEKTSAAYKVFRDQTVGLQSIKDKKIDTSNVAEVVDAIVKETFAPLAPGKITEDVAKMLFLKTMEVM